MVAGNLHLPQMFASTSRGQTKECEENNAEKPSMKGSRPRTNGDETEEMGGLEFRYLLQEGVK